MLRTLDDAVAADREILRVLTVELRDTLAARDRIGGAVDKEVEARGGKLETRRRIVGRRRRRWNVGMVVNRVVSTLVLALLLWWAWRAYL